MAADRREPEYEVAVLAAERDALRVKDLIGDAQELGLDTGKFQEYLRKRKAAIEDRGNRARERVARSESALADAAAQQTIADQIEARQDRHIETARCVVE